MRDAVATVGTALVGLAVIVVVLNSVFGLAFDFVGGDSGADQVFEPAPDALTFVTDGTSVSDAFDVTPGTGTAVGLSADGYVDIPPPDAATRADGWAIVVTAEPQTIDSDNSYTVYAEDNATIYVAYEAGNYSAWYESNGSHGYVTAPASGGQESIGVQYNSSVGELELYLDGAKVDSSVLSASAEPRQPAYEWDGTLDEFRRYERSIGAAGHAAYAADPVQVIDPANATHRAMFNSDDADEVYFANGSASLIGDTEIVDGVQPPELDRGSDFELATDPIRIRATSGGYLDRAPVVFVFADGGTVFGALLQQLAGVGGSALGLLVVGVLVAAAVAVTEEFGGM